MPSLYLTLKSLNGRRMAVTLTVVAIAFSVALLLGVERIRVGARATFERTIAGTDMIVGARTGDVQLLLYSVFRIGGAPGGMSWESHRKFAEHPDVAWSVPLALGDSHRGYRVMGTDLGYFEHYRFGRKEPLAFAAGRPFDDVFDAVLGWEVAAELGYRLEHPLVLSHGVTLAGAALHEEKPFKVVGILQRTSTPVDRTVHISLAGIEALHIDWKQGKAPKPGEGIPAETLRTMTLQPEMITAALIGVKSPFGLFRLRREINTYEPEALSAILPGATLANLWGTVTVAETALRTISVFVVITGLIGMLTSILTTLNERRREMAILRSVGARPIHVFGLLVTEAVSLSVMGCALGVALLFGGLVLAQPIIEGAFGLFIPVSPPGLYDALVVAAVVILGGALGCIPAWRAYRTSLADGLTVRL